MSAPTLLQIDRVPVAEVIARDRLRPVREAGVESLIASITELGVMKDAIHVRKKKDGSLHLLAGAHRLEAALRLGWAEIQAKVWTNCTDDWAQLVEIDDNLAGAEMDPLDTAVFLAARKEVYERLHPEAKAKTGSALVAHRWNTADTMSVASFAASTAEKFGLTDRHVRRMIAAGAALSLREVELLRQAPRPVSLKDLGEIAKIGNVIERGDVVLRLSGGNAKSAADARRSLRVEQGLEAPAKAPVDQQYLTLKSAWVRASKEARRRFIEDHFDELSPLVVDQSERLDEAEVAVIRAAMGVAAE